MPNILNSRATPSCTSQSTTARKIPKKNTAASTTLVVETASSRLGQVTCFISTRTSCRNSRALWTVPVIFSPIPAAAPVIAPPSDSPFFTFTACVAMPPLPHRRERHECPSHEALAGEEGFEPPYPAFETRVLNVGPLP